MRKRALLVAVVAVAVLVPAVPAFAQTTAKPNKAAEECIKKLEKGGTIDDCQKAPSPILPATNELVWGSISFVLLFLLMKRFAYPAVKKGMDGRAEKIRSSLDEAERVRGEAETILQQYQRQLAEAKAESARIVEEARQAADKLRQDLKRQAETEVTEMRARAQEDIQAQTDRAMADLQARVAELAIELAEKVVERSLDRETNLALIEEYINQVGASSS